jgi:hypothetical protein
VVLHKNGNKYKLIFSNHCYLRPFKPAKYLVQIKTISYNNCYNILTRIL